MSKVSGALIFLSFICNSALHAENLYSTSQGHLYASLDAGIMQANFNANYLDQTDIIPQNISESILQNGYTGGVALGYSRLFREKYFLGAELSAYFNSHSAMYESGAATAAFSDKIKFKNTMDLTVVPGIITNDSSFPYIKLGLSYASLSDYLTSPVGYNPVITNYNASKNAFGFVAALGIKRALTAKTVLFTEVNYHDLGTLQWPSFQNFSAEYSHSAHLCSYALVLGAMYAFNV